MLGLVAAWALDAGAAERQFTFHAPRQDRQGALLAVAQQAGISLGFAPGARCGGAVALEGRMPVDAAFRRLLEGSDCSLRWIDARSVVVTPRRAQVRPAEPPPQLAPVQPVELSELVITAEKRESLLSSSASGLTAVPAEDLAREGVGDTGDLSLLAAGVLVTNLGPGRNKILLRGVSDGPLTGHTQSTVGIYLGEMRLTYNAPDPDLPLVDIARVEVLRGPQGSLYGSGSIGGVVHVVPTAPDLHERSGRVSGEYGITAHGAASYETHLVLNQPLKAGRAALRLAAWAESSGGYIDDPARGARDIDRSRRRGVRLAGLWRPTETLGLDATLVHQSIGTRDAHYAQPATGALARSTLAAEPHDNDFTALSLTAHWSPDWGRLTATVSALDHDVVNTYDAAFAPPALFVAAERPTAYKDENEIRALVAETRLASSGAQRLQWIVGGFGSIGEQTLIGDLRTASGRGGYLEHREDRLVEAALFGEASYDITTAATLTAGGRLFHTSLKTASRVSLGPGASAFSGRTTYNGFAPKVRIAYRPQPGLTIYATASEGYRTAGFNTAGPPGQVFGEDAGITQLARRYGGDELWSYEAGARWRSPDGRIALRAALVQSRWRDVQADLFLPSGLPFTAGLGDGRARAFELEAAYRSGPLRLSGNLVRQDSALTRGTLGLNGRAEAALPDAPQFAFGFSLAYALPMTERWRADLRAHFTYVGRSSLTVDGATSAAMGGYGELRLGASFSSGPTTLDLSVDNVLGSRGDTLAFGNPFSFGAGRQTTPQRPQTFRARLERRF